MAEKRRPPIVGRYTQEELALASRNSGMPLEAPAEAMRANCAAVPPMKPAPYSRSSRPGMSPVSAIMRHNQSR
jgi:hypothetical protein